MSFISYTMLIVMISLLEFPFSSSLVKEIAAKSGIKMHHILPGTEEPVKSQ